MFPPSKALLSFIQVGGVHGLAHRRMFEFRASAALMYGISRIRSRAIEKLVIAVSLAVSFSV